MSSGTMEALSLEQARAWLADAHDSGKTVGFVPTMGALHAGHLSLVRRACAENDVVCVSVFVNPLQFENASDLERYPRDLDADAEMVASAAAASRTMLFTGTLAGFFPEAKVPAEIPMRDAGPASVGLEGEHRAGHFEGVATILARLFEVVRPNRAYFGEKDYQQTLVAKRVAASTPLPTSIAVCPTLREADGLAMSSRNVRLDSAARARATCLWRGLTAARAAWESGERDAVALTHVLRQPLDVPGIELEYAELRDPSNWGATAPTGALVRARALVAARIGGVRLIDNLRLDTDES